MSRSKRSTHRKGVQSLNPPKPGSRNNNVQTRSVLSWFSNRLLIVFALATCTLILYSPVGNHPFINYDDPDYVVGNVHIKDGLSWKTLTWALTSTEQANWHPLTWMSHALDFQLFGANPAGHHWMSVAIHTFNVVLLFLLLQRVSGYTGRSFLVAAMFAWHPLNVESVAWVAERKNVLSTMLLLLTLAAYASYARRPGVKRYSLVAGLFLLGLAAKPMLVTLPGILLLMDYWPLCRVRGWSSPSQAFPTEQQGFRILVLEKLPLLALSVGSAVLTLIAQRVNLMPMEQLSYASRLENAAYSYWMYLAKAFWPAALAIFYPRSAQGLPLWHWLGASIFLAAFSVVVWKRASSRPFLLVGWLWFLGTLVPVLGIVQVGAQSMADRYAYVPLIGIFVGVVWSLRLHIGLTAQIVIVTIVLGALAVTTWHQLQYWQSDYALWSHTLDVTHDNVVAEDKLGIALQALGRQDKAVSHFANAVRLNPSDPLGNFSIGADLHWHGRLQEAISHYELAIQGSTDLRLKADAYQNLGTAFLQLGDRVQAREDFLLALKDNPSLITVFAGLGELASEEARTLSRSVVQHPTDQGYLQLGRAFQEEGLVSEARCAYDEALILNPTLEDARLALAALNNVSR